MNKQKKFQAETVFHKIFKPKTFLVKFQIENVFLVFFCKDQLVLKIIVEKKTHPIFFPLCPIDYFFLSH